MYTLKLCFTIRNTLIDFLYYILLNNNFLTKGAKMGDNELKAQQLIAEAQKKLTSSKGFFGSLFG